MSLEISLQNAISGLMTSKTALQVISNNIANVNTEGYTRKVVEHRSRIIEGKGYGVELATISRNVDAGVLKQLRNETATLEGLTIREDYLSQLNTFFGRPSDDDSIAHKISNLGAQFDALAVSPETGAAQFLSVEAAQDVITEIERVADQVQRLRANANTKLSDVITDFNTKMNTVVDVNFDVIRYTASNISTAEIEDERDKAINDIAEIMDIKYFEKTDGSYSVYTTSGQTLIDGQKQNLTYTPPATMNSVIEYTPVSAVNYQAPGNADYPIGGIPGIFVGEVVAGTDITNGLGAGLMKGLIDLRDTDLPAIQSQLDELAEKLKRELNQVHNKGTGFPPPAKLTGDNFVTTATNIDVSTGIVIIGVVDTSGNQIETEYIDLADFSTVGNLLSDGTNGINDKFTNLTASIDTDGYLSLSASGGHRIAINEMTSSMSGAGKIGTGFSDFFGMNNLYSSNENFSSYRSNYYTSSSSAVITTGGTLQFTDSSNTSTVNYSANATLSDLATAITAATGITASVVANGAGFRMEIEQDSGNDFAIVETGSGTFLSETGVRPDYRGISSRLSVRSDLKSNTYFISRGSLQSNTFNSATGTDPAAALTGGSAAEVLTFHIDSSTKVALTLNTSDGSNTLNSVAAAINADATLSAAGITAEVVIDGSNYSIKISDAEGNNFWVNDETSSGSGVAGSLGIVTTQGISVGDGSMAEALAEEFNAITTFLEAPAGGGGMSETNTTLSAYASNILAFNSVQVSTIQRDLSFQENLTLELFSKHNSISGVNMDEELSNLIVIEQAYLAAARMITTTQELFKVLSNMVG